MRQPDRAFVLCQESSHLQAGADVMITIFFDFRQFSAKNWRFSQKPML
jgi:hypothetical protein